MDSTGKIHELAAEQLDQIDAAGGAKELTPIPEAMIGRVTFLTGGQRRAWRELVRSGVDAEVALKQVQATP